MAKPSKTISAVRKLELSQVSRNAVQRELMGEDVSIDKFMLYFNSKMQFDVSSRIINATIDRSIEASSALKVTINDYDRAVLTSGQLNNKLDVQIDGLWFRLMGVDKQGDNLDLTFEDREIAVLRNYTKFKKVSRAKATRAEFVLNLIREVKEFHIPVVIPELHRIMPIERFQNDTIGIDTIINKDKGIVIQPYGDNLFAPKLPKGYGPFQIERNISRGTGGNLTVKGAPADPDQKTNANIILAVGTHLGVSRKLMVCAIMTAIVESELHNVDHGDSAGPDSRGLFQQRSSWGSYDDRMNPETSSVLFYRAAIAEDKKNPDLAYWDLCYHVQKCAYEVRTAYAKWFHEGQDFANAYGVPGGDKEGSAADANAMSDNVLNGPDCSISLGSSTGGAYYFYRATIEPRGSKNHIKPENSWTCILRLARDVDYRAFFVSGTFYWIAEDLLFKQKPQFNLNEFMDGITDIDGEYHMGKGNGSLTVQARVGRWMAPPGTCIVIQDMGPWNGRWIVSEYSRSLFDLNATITLKKPRPVLPEPLQGNEQDLNMGLNSWSGKTTTPAKNPGTGKDVAGQDYVPDGTQQTIAQQLWHYRSLGVWTDNHGGEDIRLTMLGQSLTNQCGHSVSGIQLQPMQIILWLIAQGYKIETYSWCSTHPCNVHGTSTPSRHTIGMAVDIAMINGVSVATDSQQAKDLVIQVDNLLANHTPAAIKPVQLISYGYGCHADADVASYAYPAMDIGTQRDHYNHIHVGY